MHLLNLLVVHHLRWRGHVAGRSTRANRARAQRLVVHAQRHLQLPGQYLHGPMLLRPEGAVERYGLMQVVLKEGDIVVVTNLLNREASRERVLRHRQKPVPLAYAPLLEHLALRLGTRSSVLKSLYRTF